MAATNRIRNAIQAANNVMQSDEFEQFLMNTNDFISRRDEEGSATTQISQSISTLNDAAQVLNQSISKKKPSSGARDERVNVISPVVIAKRHRHWLWLVPALAGLVFALLGNVVIGTFADVAPEIATDLGRIIFGWPFWIFLLGYIAFNLWKNSYVMIPDGCQALITRFGKVVDIVEAGRTYIINPWNRVGYIVNIVKEYPYNAPIREAPTSDQVNASVDLFLQFRINDPRQFIFNLGGVNGFSEKLQNAISEQTRALIYSQRAEDIYDLIGESTNQLLVSLNEQFMPAVEFVNANITHAEPSAQNYRMDLAAPEMVRVAKEAYTYEYELNLRKKRDLGDLDRELAGLKETFSGINAEIATYQAQIRTAEEKEVNRANAYAAQLMIEAESAAKANVALFEAQALDIRALKSAEFPEILDYRFEQNILRTVKDSADKLPQLIQLGDQSQRIDYVQTALEMLGFDNTSLFADKDIADIRRRSAEISQRVEARAELIRETTTAAEEVTVQTGEVS